MEGKKQKHKLENLQKVTQWKGVSIPHQCRQGGSGHLARTSLTTTREWLISSPVQFQIEKLVLTVFTELLSLEFRVSRRETKAFVT